MLSESSRPQRPRIGNPAIPSATDRPKGENPEAEPVPDISQRLASQMEVTLEDGGGDLFDRVFKKRAIYHTTLKNGEPVDMASGYEAWETLNRLLTTRPELIAAAWAKLRGDEVSPTMSRELRKIWLTGRNGELMPQIRDVLLSGYQETGDGPVIVNPFRLDTEDDRRAFEALEKLAKENRSRFLKHFRLPPGAPGSTPPPSNL